MPSLSRRRFLRVAGATAGTALLGACAPKVIKETVVVEKAVEKVVKETVVVKEAVEVEKEVTRVVEKVVEKEAPQKAAEPVTISYFAYAGGSSEDIEDALVKRFQEMHPNVTIEWSILGWPQYADKRKVMIAGRTIQDVFAFSSSRYFIEGALADLTPFWERDLTEINVDDLVPALNRGWICKKLWGISQGGSNHVLWYNKDQFDEAGVPYPDWDLTWEGFAEMCVKLTHDSKGRTPRDSGFDKTDVVQWGTAGGPWIYKHTGQWGPVWNAYGGKWFDNDEAPTRWTILDKPEAIAGAQLFFDLIHKYQCMPPQELKAAGGQTIGFDAGGSSTVYVWSEVTVGFQKNCAFDWRAAPMPKGPAKRSTWSAIKYYSMAEWSKQKDWAWEFLKFLNSEAGWQIKSALGTGLIPARYSVLKSPWFMKPFPNLDKELLGSEEIMNSIDPWPGGWIQEFMLPDGISTLTEDPFEECVLGNKTAEQVFKEIEPQLQEKLKEGMAKPIC
ncbi:MAG: extracellular solute-binding protein [Chloroflexi bacterium]|nr:extracellular solute-binding protein [Chloroflexota bacterium]